MSTSLLSLNPMCDLFYISLCVYKNTYLILLNAIFWTLGN